MTSILVIANIIFGINLDNLSFETWSLSKTNGYFYLKANNLKELKNSCIKNNKQHLVFPAQFHSYQEIVTDKESLTFGNKNFSLFSQFIRSVSLNCSSIIGANKIEWRTISYSPYFNRVLHEPYLVSSSIANLKTNYFSWIFYLLVGASLLLFLKLKLLEGITILLLSVYQYFLTPLNFFNFKLSMLSAHSIADFCLWLALLIILVQICKNLLINKINLYLILIIFSPLISNFFIANNGDEIQATTVLLLITSIGAISHIYWRLFKLNLITSSVSLVLSIYFLFCFNDGLFAFGLFPKTYSVITLSSLAITLYILRSSKSGKFKN